MRTTSLNRKRPPFRARVTVGAVLAVGALLFAAPLRAAEAEPGAKAVEALTKAFAAQDAKDWAGATALAEKQPAVVRDLVQWRYVSSATSGATFDEIDAFLVAHTNWPGRSLILQRGEETLLANALVETKGDTWFKAHPPRTSAGCLALAKFQFAHDAKAEALSGIRRCWLALTLSTVDYQDWTNTTQATLSESDHLARADTLLWGRNVSVARELLPLLSAKMQGVVGARANIQSGTVIDLDDALDDAPPAWAVSLFYDEAVRLRKAGKAKDGWSALMKADDSGALPTVYAQTWWLEHNTQARAALDAGELETAYRLASRTHLSASNNIAAYLDAEFLSGWIALRNLDKPKKAMTHFQNLAAAAKAPATRARAAYWQAMALRARGKETAAQKSLAVAAAEPATFYGRLALEMLPASNAATSPAPNKPFGAAAGEDIEELVQASAVLLRAGDNRRANAFANAALDGCQSTACVTTLSARLSTLGNTYGALRSAKKAQTMGVTLPDQLYPMPDLPEACGAARVPSALILALTRQESEFDPSALSNANARGLMQLLPSTAQDMARRYGIKLASADDLNKPEINLSLGCYYIKDLLDALGGSQVLAIASYNAGKTRVLGWTTTHGDPRDAKSDVIDWIEAIPLDETRNYVMRVLENELVYKARRGEALQPQELSIILNVARRTP